MTSLAERTIEAYRETHDRLAALVRDFSEQDLARRSGSAEWTVAQVLSHLGSGAEIGLDTLRAGQAGRDRPADSNESVWARWNALAPAEQSDGFLRVDDELCSAYEALSPEELAVLSVPVSFLPQPADAALLTGMRLSEAALHAWDVEVALDAHATIPQAVAVVMVEQLRGPLSFTLGFSAKLDGMQRSPASLLVRTTAPETRLGLQLGDGVRLGEAPPEPDGAISLPLEALPRLLAGRLSEPHTPTGVLVTGAVSLDDLRRAFPGY